MIWHDFSEVLEDRTGNNPKLKVSDYEDHGEVPVIDQGKQFISGYSNDRTLNYRYNSPLIIFGDHTCIFKYVDFPFILGADGVKALELKIEAHAKYLYYYLQTSKIPDTGYDRHFKYLKRIKIPLPPLETQKKITSILDKADELRRNDRKILEKYDQLAQSVFLEMFGDPIMNPNKWIKKKLVEVCKKITDGTHHSPPMCSYGIPYVTAKHIKKYGLDFEKNPTYISEEDHRSIFKRCPSEYGDVLYIKDGATTGIAAINTLKQEISLLSSLALLKPDTDQILSIYLCSWLNNENVKTKLLLGSMAGAAIQRFTLDKIKKFVIQVPDLKLQSKFSEIIQDINKQRKLTHDSLEKSEYLFQSLLQRAFRGELV